MTCPTCDHTMHGIMAGNFWCPRCGTVKYGDATYTPMLVDRCRLFEGVCQGRDYVEGSWKNFGIAESINTPLRRLT